ncbi:MAG: hypothetical protein ACTSQK_11625 [Candidatus Heimdallarchaeota archaeon]
MKRTSSKSGPTFPTRKLLFSFIILLVIIQTANLTNLDIVTQVTAATEEEAFDSIISAFDKIEQASVEGIAVQSYVDELNVALVKYHDGLYDEAFTIAEAVKEEITEVINSARWGKIFPYVIIPVNVVLIAAIAVFFGRNILGWFRNRRDEEYLDLEIVYETDPPIEENGEIAAEKGE